MIGKNWIRALTVTGLTAVAALPLISSASTHYTGKLPASIAMMATSTPTPVKKVSSVHKVKKLHHKSAIKASLKKNSLHKKHKAASAKVKHTA